MNKIDEVEQEETPFCFNHSVLLWAFLPWWLYHIVHLNIFVNIRLEGWKTFAPCQVCWTPVNLLFCKFGLAREKTKGLQYCCQDRFPNPPTVLRHFVMVCYAIGMDSTLKAYAGTVEQDKKVKGVKSLVVEAHSLGSLLLIYAFQVLIFVAFRIAYLLFITIFCCGCKEQGANAEMHGLEPETEEEKSDANFDKFQDQIFSYDYEKYTIKGRDMQEGISEIFKRRKFEQELHDFRHNDAMVKIQEANRR